MKWWLVTWTTYATWLPGDPRGFQTWRARVFVPPPPRYAKPGERTYEPEPWAAKHRMATRDSDPPVRLTPEQRVVVLKSILEELEQMAVESAVLAVDATHVHWLARFGQATIRPAVGRLKAAATRRLKENGFQGKRPWTKNCHMKSKNTEHEFATALNYVVRHERQGADVYVWPKYRST
jgi:hypothetical protein